MTRRATRSDLPHDPAAVVRALRACRVVMVDVCARVKPMGPAYHGASMVMAAIDGFAAFLTGHRYYFSTEGSVMSGRKETVEDREAREKGEKPWEG